MKSLFKLFKEIATRKGFHIEVMNGLEDHFHLLVRMTGSQSVSAIVKDLKGVSSRWINEKGMIPGRLPMATWLWGIFGESVFGSFGEEVYSESMITSWRINSPAYGSILTAVG